MSKRGLAVGVLLLSIAALAFIFSSARYGYHRTVATILSGADRLWAALSGSVRGGIAAVPGFLIHFPGDLLLFVPLGALLLFLVYGYFVGLAFAQLPTDNTGGSVLRPIRRTSLAGETAVYEPTSLGLPPSAAVAGSSLVPAPSATGVPKVSPFEGGGAGRRPAGWAGGTRSEGEPTGTTAAPVDGRPASGRWTGAASESPPAPSATGPASMPPPGMMTVWTTFGKTTVPNDLPPPSPVSGPPPSSKFGPRMLTTFVLVTCTLVLLRDAWLSLYDRLVNAVASVLYYQVPSSSPFAYPIASHPFSDYILMMYLSLLVSWGIASGLFWSRRFRVRQRLLAFEVLAFYFAIEALVDAIALGAQNSYQASAFLVVRGLLGGFFSLLLLFDSFVLPRPVIVEPRFPRRRGSVALFLGLGALSVLIAGGILYLLWGFLSTHGISIPFAVLLLEPLLTVVVFDMIGSLVYQRELRRRPVPSVQQYHPSVSIIIPAYNEARGIAASIRAADTAARLYPGPTEIIVGNDGSSDATSEIARAEMHRLQHASGIVVDLPHGGKSNALNGALRVAQGEILIRVDADTRISPDYGFTALIPHFADAEVGAIQGLILPLQRKGWVRKMRLLEICWNHLFLRRGLMATRATQVVDGAFCAFRRNDVLSAGGWVYWNGEDNEITLRLYRIGFRTRYEPRAVAFEDVPDTYRSLRKQRVRWNRGGVYAHRRHMGALRSGAFEFGGIAILVWVLMFMKGGMRYFIYVYALLITLLAGVATLYTVAFLLILLLVIRGSAIAYYIARLGWWRDLVWIPMWPIASALKQSFAVDAFGTMVPGKGSPEFSE